MKKLLLCTLMLLPLVSCSNKKIDSTSISNKLTYYFDSKYIEKVEYSIRKGETVYFPFIQNFIEKREISYNDIILEGIPKIKFEGDNLDKIIITANKNSDNYTISCIDEFEKPIKIKKFYCEFDNIVIVSECDITINYLKHDDSSIPIPKFNGYEDSLFFSEGSEGLITSCNAKNAVWFRYGNVPKKRNKFVINNIEFVSKSISIKNVSYCMYNLDVSSHSTLIDEDLEYKEVKFPMELIADYKLEQFDYAIKLDLEDNIDNESFYTGGTIKFDLTIDGDKYEAYDSIYYRR